MALPKMDHGEIYEDPEIKEQLEAIGFSREENGTFVLKRTGIDRKRGLPDLEFILKEKTRERRIYAYLNIDPAAGGGGLVYAPDQYSAGIIVWRIRYWMAHHKLL